MLMYFVRVSPMGGIFCSTRSISSNLDLKSCSSALSWHCSMECWCCHWQFKPMCHLVAHCGVMRTQSVPENNINLFLGQYFHDLTAFH